MKYRLMVIAALVAATLVPAGMAAAKSPFDAPPKGPPPSVSPPKGPFDAPPKGPPPWVSPPKGPFANTVTFVVVDYVCQEGGGFSNESIAVWLRRSEAQAGMTVTVDDGEPQPWEAIFFETANDVYVGWPGDYTPPFTPLNPDWNDSFALTVRGADGTVLYQDTYTIEGLLIEQPLCAPLFAD